MTTTTTSNQALPAHDVGPTPSVTGSTNDFSELTPAIVESQQRFYDTRIKHPKLKELIDDLLPLLMPHSETNIIVLTGATGAGKSTLTRQILKTLLADFSSLAEADSSAIPLVNIEAYSNGEGKHGFKSIFEDIATELQEPSMQKKRVVMAEDGRLIARPNGRHTVSSLRKVVENGLRMRKTRVLVIDEAAHLIRFGRDMAPIDTLKSLANTCGVKLVLVGSFDLLDLVAANGQIARRTSVLLLDRYRLEDSNDRVAFKNVLQRLMTRWPCEDVPNFLAVERFLHEVTFGCVGLLKSVLLDAAAFQLRNHGRWKPEFLVKASKSGTLFESIRKEIEVGEAKVRDALVGRSIWGEDALNKLMSRMAK